MGTNKSFLTSKVARRIFLLFVVCALVPITGLATYSFGRVSRQLYQQGEDRLDNAVREIGQGLTQRLQLLETELRLARVGADATTGPLALDDLRSASATETPRLLGVAMVDRRGTVTPLIGDTQGVARPRAEDLDQLATGRALLRGTARVGRPPLLLLTQAIDPEDTAGDLIVGSINPTYLWTGAEDTLGTNELCVFDDNKVALWCTRPPDGVVPPHVTETLVGSAQGGLEWEVDGNEYLASFWSIPLAYQFDVQWTLLLSESRADMLAPMAGFRYFFSLIVLVSLWVVLLLSIGQIRRSLVPLELLREGARKIGDGDFHSHVDVSSGDEFEELADSFNDMAARLGKQFGALATIAEIDRAILSTVDIERIVHTALKYATDLVECHSASITLVSPDQQKVPRTYALRNRPGAQPWVETTFFDNNDLRRFEANPHTLEFGPEDGTPAFLAPLARSGCQSFVVFPMFINDEPSGAIALGFRGEFSYDDDDRLHGRQLTEQVAVALANAHLVEDLDALNWGALTALARTVDAKSPWTAGHSERVTAMGIKIGEMMKLPKEEIDILHRGGLLHDIGKIGVPAAILDKPGKLTEEEFALMRKHPEIGANILQPIAAYADVIPIVRQHHEKWDGTGYPDGLAGLQIHPHARIFAVADVYDAVISDRPYRAGFPPDKVVRIIVEGDGTHFEPAVVAAFLEVMTDEGCGVLADNDAAEVRG